MLRWKILAYIMFLDTHDTPKCHTDRFTNWGKNNLLICTIFQVFKNNVFLIFMILNVLFITSTIILKIRTTISHLHATMIAITRLLILTDDRIDSRGLHNAIRIFAIATLPCGSTWTSGTRRTGDTMQCQTQQEQTIHHYLIKAVSSPFNYS